MVKARDIFLDHFARLGVFSKVHSLAGPPDVEEDGIKSHEEGGVRFFFMSFIILYPFHIAKSWRRLVNPTQDGNLSEDILAR